MEQIRLPRRKRLRFVGPAAIQLQEALKLKATQPRARRVKELIGSWLFEGKLGRVDDLKADCDDEGKISFYCTAVENFYVMYMLNERNIDVFFVGSFFDKYPIHRTSSLAAASV